MDDYFWAAPEPKQVPESPSGRVPQWVLDEAAGRPPQHAVAWRAHETAPVLPAARGRRSRSWVVGLLVLAGVGGAVAVGRGPETGMSVSAGVERGTGGGLPSAGRDPSRPTPGAGSQGAPLGAPVPVATTSSSYRFIDTQADGTSPVAYDPCRPIHVVVRTVGAPPGGGVLVAAAVANVARATGLTFRLDGATAEQPSPQREPYQPDLYGDRWAPVLIAWETTERNPQLVDGVIGLGGSSALSLEGGPKVYVSGQIELDARQFDEVLAGPRGEDVARSIIQHELAHVVGLDHVDDQSELMFPQAQEGVFAFGPGDLTGLAALGQGTCAPDL